MAARRQPRRPDQKGRPGRAAAAGSAGVAGAVGRAGRLVAAGSAGVALALGRRAVAAACGETGRRLARAAALTVVLAILVMTLYDRGEAPSAAAQPAGGPQSGSPPRGRADAARRPGPPDHGGLRGRATPARAGERPAAVAAAWYAARHGLPRAKVKPLQQDRLSPTEVRVLVLADPGHGRLRTALVRVRRGPGGWSVR
jgi:hypothetical protein